jgi:hypothetical protein
LACRFDHALPHFILPEDPSEPFYERCPEFFITLPDCFKQEKWCISVLVNGKDRIIIGYSSGWYMIHPGTLAILPLQLNQFADGAQADVPCPVISGHSGQKKKGECHVGLGAEWRPVAPEAERFLSDKPGDRVDVPLRRKFRQF